MALNPNVLGTWQVDLSKTAGLDDFARVMGFTPERTEKYKNLDYTVSISKDGDTYKIEVDFKGAVPKASYSLKIGQEIDYKSVDGYTAKLTLSVEDGKSVESYVYAEKGLKWTVTRSVEGNVMIAVTKIGDAVLTQTLNKV
uniref:Lipocalin/cytosolic fatty-acid binding domain-containing protein n=1 Tax=Arion vulgaris TaxID=1028688 RepID=A0A0B6ZZK4_9EUPU